MHEANSVKAKLELVLENLKDSIPTCRKFSKIAVFLKNVTFIEYDRFYDRGKIALCSDRFDWPTWADRMIKCR